MSKTRLWVAFLLCALSSVMWTRPAEAQLRRGDFRLALDTDMISIAGVTVDPDGPGKADTMVFGIGPNQLGQSRAAHLGLDRGSLATSPFGLGLHWTLSHKLQLGLRTGFGFDIYKPDGADDNLKVLALSLMPTLTIVPIGRKAKLFIALAPLLQVNRLKIDEYINRVLLGGFSTGIGALIFAGSAVSVDLGFFFEGRFGNERVELDDNADTSAHIQVLQGVVRLGISLWR